MKELEEKNNFEKTCLTKLDIVKFYCYDFLITPIMIEDISSRNIIEKDLELWNIKVKQENKNNEFIYFICSRTKVIFDISIQPKYCPSSKTLTVHLKVGESQEKKEIACDYSDFPEDIITNISLTERTIKIDYSTGGSFSSSIHNFLQYFDIKLNIYSEIHHIDSTKNYLNKTIDENNVELQNILSNTNLKEKDLLIYYNLFSSTLIPNNIKQKTDRELNDKIELQIEIITKALNSYFCFSPQCENELKELMYAEQIKEIDFVYDEKSRNEYYSFFSKNIAAKHKHIFEIK